MPTAMTPRLVLISGVSGFLGTATTLEFLKKGWKVRGTVRRQEQADAWIEKYPQYRDHIHFVIVRDLADDGAFDEAIKGVDAVAHTASPFTFSFEDNVKDMLEPALKGTTSILEAAKREPSVKSVVITSSLAAAQDPAKGLDPGFVRTSAVWSPFTWEQAAKETIPAMVYLASKTFAERAAWDFFEREKPNFSLATIVPPIILGEALQPLSSLSDLNLSAAAVKRIIDAEEIPPTAVPVFVNVNDCARAHVEAIERARTSRYLLIGGDNDNCVIAQYLREDFPEQAHRIPTKGDPVGPHWSYDCTPAVKELGIEFTNLRTTIKQAGEQLFHLEKELPEKKQAVM
ncbi:ketoreductase [Rhodotorula toruloides]|uniref:Ketoreductase n=1 Tax=Rhodotorula toruloides TaxID=5286 RepID=A0A511KAC2_RHOTO|nr:ketoreductase [Rhodotorula toruloides]